tara:strand:- start:8771 stop:9217 length:447 start_codon:yes stop_codon:yes gene_type:complete
VNGVTPLLILVVLISPGCNIGIDRQLRDDGKVLPEELFPIAKDRHVIELNNDKTQYHVSPLSIEISSGDWIEIISLDHKVHTLSFVADSISHESYDFLIATDQLNGPPLLERGSSFLVDFRDAPKGRYVFSSSSHGESVYGIITVRKD